MVVPVLVRVPETLPVEESTESLLDAVPPDSE